MVTSSTAPSAAAVKVRILMSLPSPVRFCRRPSSTVGDLIANRTHATMSDPFVLLDGVFSPRDLSERLIYGTHAFFDLLLGDDERRSCDENVGLPDQVRPAFEHLGQERFHWTGACSTEGGPRFFRDPILDQLHSPVEPLAAHVADHGVPVRQAPQPGPPSFPQPLW